MVQALVDVEGVRRRLEEVKARRIEEAERLGIYGMAVLVATELGSRFGKVHGSYYVFPPLSKEEFMQDKERSAPLGIVYDDYGPNLEVWSRGRKVFAVHLGDITLYVPGSWVNDLVNLHKTAKAEAVRRRVKAEIEAIKEEARKWGIPLEELGLCGEEVGSGG